MPCPLCRDDSASWPQPLSTTLQVTCPNCGNYHLTFSANRELENDEECAFYLGSWVFSQNRNGVTPRIDTYVLNSFKTYVRPDLQKRAELYLGQAIRLLGGRLSGRVEIDHSSLRVSSWSFHREDLKALAHYLVELGAISWEPGTENYQLVAKAHVLYDQWANTRGMTSQAFVAMWFDPQMKEAYDRGFEVAVTGAGYSALRIDRK